jgi:hypothetical protein
VGAEVDQVPVVDLVAASQVELVEPPAAALGCLVAAGPLAHAVEPTGPDLVDRTGEQLVELVGWQVNELLGQRDDVAHAHAEEHLSLLHERAARAAVAASAQPAPPLGVSP